MSFFLNWSEESYEYILTIPGYVALTILMLGAMLLILALKKDNKQKMSAKEIAFFSSFIALATVASFIKFSSLPYGGSITLFSMLFICFIGYVYGTRVGVMAGIAYGILQLILGPYIYHPLQVILDYPLAFGALGLSGLFAKRPKGFLPGYIIGVAGRYICHVISGYVFFASYAPEGTNPMVYTLGYNATYIVPEMIATVVILAVPAVSGAFLKLRNLAEETA